MPFEDELKRTRERLHAITADFQKLVLTVESVRSALRETEQRIPAQLHEKVTRLETQMQRVSLDIDAANKTLDALDQKYVPLTRYAPIERVVFGAVGTILLIVLTGLVALVLKAKL